MELLGLLSILSVAYAYTIPPRSHPSAADNEVTSLTLLYQNNLNGSDDINHIAVLLTDPVLPRLAETTCQKLGSTLLQPRIAENHLDDIQLSLAYQAFAYGPSQGYYLADSILTVNGNSTSITSKTWSGIALPALCASQSTDTQASNSSATTNTAIFVRDDDSNLYHGYYNQKSFRFLGIRYAEEPQRWQYTELYEPKEQLINATSYGSQCVQSGGGSEDCFFLNIQTPFIPKAGQASRELRPVMFWIHGGGFTGGTGSDPTFDGGNLASREDIVVVSINYRLGALGFLAIPGTNISGNFGIGDQITALDWTIKNIAYFGGDPNRITINGESAGAGSVRTLLGSPEAIGKFQGAVAMSNLGGGQDLGRDSNYGTTYSLYYTIEESYNVSGQPLLDDTNCTMSTLTESIACLAAFNATLLNTYAMTPRYVVQDGTIVNTPELPLTSANNGTANVPVIFGIVQNDGASFSNLVDVAEGNLTGALQAGLDISPDAAQSIIDSGLFPYQNITGNYTLDAFNVTQRVATDNTFRCIDQATVYAGAVNKVFPATYYYEFDRSIGGYNPNDVPGAPVEPGYPDGDPNEPYFKLHGAELNWVFGNFYDPFRDANDLYSLQLVSGMFAAFIRTGTPNPNEHYLLVRNYQTTLQAIREVGPWRMVEGQDSSTNVRHMDYPGYMSGFVDQEQCTWLNYSTSYYL